MFRRDFEVRVNAGIGKDLERLGWDFVCGKDRNWGRGKAEHVLYWVKQCLPKFMPTQNLGM